MTMTIAERIAALPAAVNIAKPFSGQLTQEKPGNRTDSTGSRPTDITDISTLRTSLYAVDNAEYSKDSAVNKQWRKMNTLNILDVLDGKADTSNLTLSATEIEKRLQQDGLLDEVSDADFNMLKFEWSGISFGADTTNPLSDSDKFRKNVDYLASRYAAMADRIKNAYAGTRQKEQLERLDRLYQDTLERTASEYADLVGGMLDKYGVSGEREKIYQSYKNSVNELSDAYMDFLHQNSGFTKLEGTKDAWLLKDDEYIAQGLRNQDILSGSSSVSKANGDYTLRDLEILGQYTSSLSAMEAKSNIYNMSEEQIGLELSMVAMKTDALVKKGNGSAMLNVTLEAALNGFMNAFLDQFDRKLSAGRTQARTAYDLYGHAGLDRKSVWSVYNKTMESYRLSGDAIHAMTKGAEYGKERYLDKMNKEGMQGIYRYKNGGAYWNQFFGNSAGMKATGYDTRGSIYGQHMMDWLGFTSSLEAGQIPHINLSFKPGGSRAMADAGNWLNVNA